MWWRCSCWCFLSAGCQPLRLISAAAFYNLHPNLDRWHLVTVTGLSRQPYPSKPEREMTLITPPVQHVITSLCCFADFLSWCRQKPSFWFIPAFMRARQRKREREKEMEMFSSICLLCISWAQLSSSSNLLKRNGLGWFQCREERCLLIHGSINSSSSSSVPETLQQPADVSSDALRLSNLLSQQRYLDTFTHITRSSSESAELLCSVLIDLLPEQQVPSRKRLLICIEAKTAARWRSCAVSSLSAVTATRPQKKSDHQTKESEKHAATNQPLYQQQRECDLNTSALSFFF